MLQQDKVIVAPVHFCSYTKRWHPKCTSIECSFTKAIAFSWSVIRLETKSENLIAISLQEPYSLWELSEYREPTRVNFQEPYSFWELSEYPEPARLNSSEPYSFWELSEYWESARLNFQG